MRWASTRPDGSTWRCRTQSPPRPSSIHQAAHLNLGDLLLTIGERETDQAKARGLFERAVEQYNLVLKAQPNSIEAVNNEAWILHSYLGQTRKAYDLVVALRKAGRGGKAARRVL